MVAAFVFLLVGMIHAHGLGLASILCDILLPFTALVGTSFVLMLDPSINVTKTSDKQPVRRTLVVTILFSFTPIGLATLSAYQPLLGVFVNLCILAGVLLVGTRFLETKASARYLYR